MRRARPRRRWHSCLRIEVHLKNRALLELIVAVYHVGAFGDADLIELYLLVYRDGDLVVLES